jgi:hypothetical protein
LPSIENKIIRELYGLWHRAIVAKCYQRFKAVPCGDNAIRYSRSHFFGRDSGGTNPATR